MMLQLSFLSTKETNVEFIINHLFTVMFLAFVFFIAVDLYLLAVGIFLLFIGMLILGAWAHVYKFGGNAFFN